MSVEVELNSLSAGVRSRILSLLQGVNLPRTLVAAQVSPVVQSLSAANVGQLCRVGPFALVGRDQAYDWWVAESLNPSVWRRLDATGSNDLSATYATLTNLALKAPIASPSLTGIPSAPTADPGTSTTQLATTAFVAAATGAIELSDVLDSPITPTVTVGGLAAGIPIVTGTAIETLFRAMLSPYVAGSFTGFTLAGHAATREVGATFTPGNATIIYSADSAGNAPATASIVGPGFGGTVTLGASPTMITASGSSTTSTTPTTTSWVLTGSDANGNALPSRTTTLAWQYAWKFGANQTVVTSNATAQAVFAAMQLSALRPGRDHNITTTADNDSETNYTYIAYQAIYGDLTSIIQGGALPVIGGFTKLGDFSITTATGRTESYRFYKSNATKAFASGVTINIS